MERAQLPVLPDVATEVLRLAEDARSSADAVARVIERSPAHRRALAGDRQLCAVRGYGAHAQRAASHHAARSATTRDLLMQIAYESSLAGMKRYVPHLERIFQKSVVCAVASRIATRELGAPVPYDYLTGLLHDIGEAHVVRLLADQQGPALGDVEIAGIAARHARAGAQVLRAWKVPEEIVEVALEHRTSPALRALPHFVWRVSPMRSAVCWVRDSAASWVGGRRRRQASGIDRGHACSGDARLTCIAAIEDRRGRRKRFQGMARRRRISTSVVDRCRGDARPDRC